MTEEWEIEIVYRRWIDGRLQSSYNFFANEKMHGHTDKQELTKEDLLRLDDVLDDVETNLRLTVPKEGARAAQVDASEKFCLTNARLCAILYLSGKLSANITMIRRYQDGSVLGI